MDREIENAFCVVRNEFLNNNSMHDALVASIASALKEIPAGTGLYDVAETVADRIIGREE